MKKFLAIISVFFSSATFSQTANYAQHNAIRECYNIVTINNKSYYVVSDVSVGSCCFENVKLVAHSTTGSKLFETAIGQMGLINRAQIAVLANKTLLIQFSSPQYKCDVGGPRTWLCNYDTLGNMLWSFPYPKQMGAALCKIDGSFYIVRSDSLLHYSSSGQIITKFLLNGGQYQYGACLTATGKIVYCKFATGGYVIEKIDTAANVISSQATANVFTDLYELPSTALLGSCGGQVLKLSANLLPIAGSSVNLSPLNVKTTFVRNDTVYSGGISSAGNLFFARFDSNFNVVSTTTSNIESAIATGVCVGNDNKIRLVAYSSSETTFSDTHSFSSFFQFSKNGSLDGSRDIGVIATQLLSYTNSASPQTILTTVSLQVTVKNFGNDTVRYFKLNSFSKSSVITTCIIGLQQDYVIAIPPQGSVVINTPAFNLSPMSVPSITSPLSFTGNICIYTSVPDSLHDIEVTNNKFCNTFNFSYQPTGIEHVERTNEVRTFPNPASDELTVVADESIREISVMDNMGRIVIQNFPNKAACQLDCSSLPAGIYVLSVKTGNAQVLKKILIE